MQMHGTATNKKEALHGTLKITPTPPRVCDFILYRITSHSGGENRVINRY